MYDRMTSRARWMAGFCKRRTGPSVYSPKGSGLRPPADTTFMALGSRVPRHGSSPFLDRLPPWLARRLGVLAGPVPEDPAQDRPLIARSLAFLFLVGASLSVVWL